MIRIDFVTLSRSDYATMRPVAVSALSDPEFKVNVIAGGSHLLKRFGYTIESIKKDGLPISASVDFLNEHDNNDVDIAEAYSRAVECFFNVFKENPPDYIFIIGDRWEMLAVATVASILRIPIAHHSGGDLTQGSADNQTRYVLTTLSHLHFVSLEEHKQRLLRMGEEEWRLKVTGEPALLALRDFVEAVPDVRATLGLEAGKDFVLATFHPTSYDDAPPSEQIKVFISVLDLIKDEIILTAPNPDPSSELFFYKLKEYTKTKENIHFYESLGTETYYAAMAEAMFMIGNSSSGLWEASSFKLPVINIGRRQDGRIRGENVLDVALDYQEIESAIKLVSGVDFKSRCSHCVNPYVKDDSVERILSTLKEKIPKVKLLAKVFVDPLTL